MSRFVVDLRPNHASSFGALRRHPTWDEVANLFKFGVDTSKGEAATTQGQKYWRLVGVTLNEGPVVYKAQVRGMDGKPKPGIRVVRYWPTAPYLYDTYPLCRDRGVIGVTEAGGDKFGAVEFQYTGGSVVGPTGGPDAFWVVSPTSDGRYASDLAFNFGWLGGTVHLNPSPVYEEVVKGEVIPSPDPDPEPPPPVDPPPAQGETLTDDEKAVLSLLTQAWNKYETLPKQNQIDRTAFLMGIHGLQRIVLSRPAWRGLNGE